MRILVLGNYAYNRQQSMQRFATLMEQALTEAEHEVRLLRPPAILGQQVTQRLVRRKKEQVGLAHCAQFQAPHNLSRVLSSFLPWPTRIFDGR